jgi:hypothetical protein
MTNPDLIAKTILLLKKNNDAEGGRLVSYRKSV